MKCVHIEPLFPKKKQNRLMNIYEQEHERQCAIAFRRPPSKYIYDIPYYPWLNEAPQVNFDLCYNA